MGRSTRTSSSSNAAWACGFAIAATNSSLSGPAQRVEAAEALLKALYEDIVDGTPLESEAIHLYLQDSGVEALMQGRATTAVC